MRDIIIDSCTLSSVFIPTSSDYNQFKDVSEALYKGHCRMVYGGSKYIEELSRVRSVLRIVLALSKKNRVRKLDDSAVDKRQKYVERIINDPAFNDPHLPAIAFVGNCHMICSKDKECMEFVKDKRLYPTHFRVPVFYTSKKNRDLLYR